MFCIICFLLKQNAMFIVAAVILIDIFSNYRQARRSQKLISYFLAFLIYISLNIVFLKKFGLWNDFIDEVFIYNSEYVNHPSFYTVIVNHLTRNNFLSIKGVSFLMVFNICMLIILWKYWKHYRISQSFSLKEKILFGSSLAYLGTYIFVYISGRTDAPYFMLLIVPATFVAGHYVIETGVGKIALGCSFGSCCYFQYEINSVLRKSLC